jgi:phenylalanyl-tRNA synthetase beta subunit
MNGVLENLLLEAVLEEGGWDCFIDGRRFVASINGQPLCWAGEIHPRVLERWDLEMPVTALEMDVDLLYSVI